MLVFSKIRKLYYRSSSVRLIAFLRKAGVKIGRNCVFRAPLSVQIDLTRPYLIEIGDNVDMNVNFKVFTHDWASLVFIAKYGQMINSAGKVIIGNNVYFGADVTILRGVTIGNNCVIGAGSVVTRSIPDDCVAVGNPCRVVCSIEEYFKKRSTQCLSEAVLVVNSFYGAYGRFPKESELIEEKIFFQKESHLPMHFQSYSDFISFCQKRLNGK